MKVRFRIKKMVLAVASFLIQSGNFCLLTVKALIQISLVGQLQLLSSAVTMLAVPSPSLVATIARKFHD